MAVDTLLNTLKDQLLDLYDQKKVAEDKLAQEKIYLEENKRAVASGISPQAIVTEAERRVRVAQQDLSDINIRIEDKQKEVDTETDNVINILREQAKTDPAALAQLQELEKGRSSSALRITLIVAGVILLIGIGIWAWRKFRKK